MHKIASFFVWHFILLLSFLPKWLFYGISNILSFLMLHLFKYRADVIDVNLARSFPSLDYWEYKEIKKKYYSHMVDLAVESIWWLTAKISSIQKIVRVKNPELLDELCANHSKVVVLLGHFGNWELMSGMTVPLTYKEEGSYSKKKMYVSYKRANSKLWNDIFCKMRMQSYKNVGNEGEIIESHRLLRHILNRENEGIYMFIADQSPAAQRIVANFLNQPTLMFNGGEYVARRLNLPVVYMSMKKVSRGVYDITYNLISLDSAKTEEGDITRKFASLLEQDIIGCKEAWLWSHKRWKGRLTEQEKSEYLKLNKVTKIN